MTVHKWTARQVSKHQSRLRDDQRLKDGEVNPEELRMENSLFAGFDLKDARITKIRGKRLAQILAMDLEHTLIHTLDDPRPRPGLYDFLERVRSRFDRLVIFTALSRADFEAVAGRLVSTGAVPAWFSDLEHFRAAPVPDYLWNEASDEIMCKDLRRVSEDIRDTLLLDDNGGYVLPGQESRWVKIEPWTGLDDDTALQTLWS